MAVVWDFAAVLMWSVGAIHYGRISRSFAGSFPSVSPLAPWYLRRRSSVAANRPAKGLCSVRERGRSL